MTKLNDETQQIARSLNEAAAQLEGSEVRRLGYRERISVERVLFLLLKHLCRTHLDYKLQGLSEAHRQRVWEEICKKPQDRTFERFVSDVFQLRVFLQSLTSTNPYVQGDALSRVGVSRAYASRVVANQLRGLARRMSEDIIGQPDRTRSR